MPSNRPVDFDELLRVLGAADAEPPPLMKKLLGELPSEQASDPAEQSVLRELEAWLLVLAGSQEMPLR